MVNSGWQFHLFYKPGFTLTLLNEFEPIVYGCRFFKPVNLNGVTFVDYHSLSILERFLLLNRKLTD